jgi:hypothetical protein
VLDDTRAAATRRGLRVLLLHAMADVDDVEDLLRVLRAPRQAASRTAAWARAQAELRGPRARRR